MFANLKKIPANSTVFISIGEIDCRENEGIIKNLKPNEKASKHVKRIVRRFVRWISLVNGSFNHTIYFFGVPAPVYLEETSLKTNEKRKKSINYFNAYLRQFTEMNQFMYIDLENTTAEENGFSSKKFMLTLTICQ